LLLVTTCSLCVVLSIYDLRVILSVAKDVDSDVLRRTCCDHSSSVRSLRPNQLGQAPGNSMASRFRFLEVDYWISGTASAPPRRTGVAYSMYYVLRYKCVRILVKELHLARWRTRWLVHSIKRIVCGVVSLRSAERNKIMKGGLISSRTRTTYSIDLERKFEIRRGGSPNSNRLQFLVGRRKTLFQGSKFETDGTLGSTRASTSLKEGPSFASALSQRISCGALCLFVDSYNVTRLQDGGRGSPPRGLPRPQAKNSGGAACSHVRLFLTARRSIARTLEEP